MAKADPGIEETQLCSCKFQFTKSDLDLLNIDSKNNFQMSSLRK